MDKKNYVLLLNSVIVFLLFIAGYYGFITYLYDYEVTKMSFVALGTYFYLMIRILFTQYTKEKIWEYSERLPEMGLVGTVVGFLIIFNIFRTHPMQSVADLHAVIPELTRGISTALLATLVGVITSMLTKFQLTYLSKNEDSSIK